MNAIPRCSLPEPRPTDIATALEDWYCDHAAIRHLWAVETPSALVISVRLEPTADGDDPLPVWLAHQHLWSKDLRVRTQREVQLKLIIADTFPTGADSSSAIVAELSWRDPWYLQA
ncbi:hypothetical protein JM946_08325 [Steroidobacter sp. S1-65]|uniref:Uncharacterized protein n=1 Tax=Steroidobacter gossypii TaxID=2805490 RepID=A0ABS1WUV1_9GAMM|nr:hypothetical protein [Steroidobacter gossypii]MBM0104750.1 hypothetical protein [Steroidobacter gossypii]